MWVLETFPKDESNIILFALLCSLYQIYRQLRYSLCIRGQWTCYVIVNRKETLLLTMVIWTWWINFLVINHRKIIKRYYLRPIRDTKNNLMDKEKYQLIECSIHLNILLFQRYSKSKCFGAFSVDCDQIVSKLIDVFEPSHWTSVACADELYFSPFETKLWMKMLLSRRKPADYEKPDRAFIEKGWLVQKFQELFSESLLADYT